MGETIPDTWAEDAVAVEEEQKEEAWAKAQYLKEYLKKQKEEEFQRMKKEQEARVARAEKILTQQDTPRQYPFSVKVSNVELFPYLFWGTIGTAVIWASRAMWQRAEESNRRGGRWVYDRSLGGKKVWVPDAIAEGQSAGRVAIRAEEFDRLVSVASAARSKKNAAKEFSLPSWWNPAVSSFPTSDITAAKQAEADRMLARIEQAKNRGEDYSIADILQLRRICQEGGVSVRPKTVGARDAIYKAAVDAAVMYAQDRTNLEISLGDGDSDYPETRLLSALAADLNLSEERAVALIKASTAAACRARLLDAVKHLKEGNEMDALVALMYLSSLVQNLPVLDADSVEPELIASSLQDSSTVEERQKIFYVLGQLYVEGAGMFAELLGFQPDLVVPKLYADVESYQKMADSGEK